MVRPLFIPPNPPRDTIFSIHNPSRKNYPASIHHPPPPPPPPPSAPRRRPPTRSQSVAVVPAQAEERPKKRDPKRSATAPLWSKWKPGAKGKGVEDEVDELQLLKLKEKEEKERREKPLKAKMVYVFGAGTPSGERVSAALHALGPRLALSGLPLLHPSPSTSLALYASHASIPSRARTLSVAWQLSPPRSSIDPTSPGWSISALTARTLPETLLAAGAVAHASLRSYHPPPDAAPDAVGPWADDHLLPDTLIDAAVVALEPPLDWVPCAHGDGVKMDPELAGWLVGAAENALRGLAPYATRWPKRERWADEPEGEEVERPMTPAEDKPAPHRGVWQRFFHNRPSRKHKNELNSNSATGARPSSPLPTPPASPTLEPGTYSSDSFPPLPSQSPIVPPRPLAPFRFLLVLTPAHLGARPTAALLHRLVHLTSTARRVRRLAFPADAPAMGSSGDELAFDESAVRPVKVFTMSPDMAERWAGAVVQGRLDALAGRWIGEEDEEVKRLAEGEDAGAGSHEAPVAGNVLVRSPEADERWKERRESCFDAVSVRTLG